MEILNARLDTICGGVVCREKDVNVTIQGDAKDVQGQVSFTTDLTSNIQVQGTVSGDTRGNTQGGGMITFGFKF